MSKTTNDTASAQLVEESVSVSSQRPRHDAHAASDSHTTSTSKLSANVSAETCERLRQLAFAHRLSESSIVEVALTMFFARGDDEMLGVLLHQLGATLRRK